MALPGGFEEDADGWGHNDFSFDAVDQLTTGAGDCVLVERPSSNAVSELEDDVETETDMIEAIESSKLTADAAYSRLKTTGDLVTLTTQFDDSSYNTTLTNSVTQMENAAERDGISDTAPVSQVPLLPISNDIATGTHRMDLETEDSDEEEEEEQVGDTESSQPTESLGTDAVDSCPPINTSIGYDDTTKSDDRKTSTCVEYDESKTDVESVVAQQPETTSIEQTNENSANECRTFSGTRAVPLDLDSMDLTYILGSLDCSAATKAAVQLSGLDLPRFIRLRSENELKLIGVDDAAERNKLLNAIQEIHRRPWDKASLARPPPLVQGQRNQTDWTMCEPPPWSVDDMSRMIGNVAHHLNCIEADLLNAQRLVEVYSNNPDLWKEYGYGNTHTQDQLVLGMNSLILESDSLQKRATQLNAAILNESPQPVSVISQSSLGRSLSQLDASAGRTNGRRTNGLLKTALCVAAAITVGIVVARYQR